MPPSNDGNSPRDLARQQQCWRQLWKELLRPLPNEKPRLAGHDELGEHGPANQRDAGDFDPSSEMAEPAA